MIIMQHCLTCAGSGTLMASGFTTRTCPICDGYGKIDIEDSIEEIKRDKPVIDKRSKAYKEAINDIMKVNPTLSRKDCESVFEKEYYK